ncbi:MAG: nucleotidyltransferase domain-containing protein [Bacteroidota bacterium]
MAPDAIPDTVRPLVDQLAAVPGVQRVILFGSRARGDHRARSDVDLALDAPTLSRTEWTRLRLDAADARTLYHVDLVRLSDAPDRLRQRIHTEGVDV